MMIIEKRLHICIFDIGVGWHFQIFNFDEISVNRVYSCILRGEAGAKFSLSHQLNMKGTMRETYREGIFVFHIVTIHLLELNTNIRCPGPQHRSCRFQILVKEMYFDKLIKNFIITISERKDAGAAIQSRTRVWWQRFLQTHPVIHRQGTEVAP